MNPSVKVGVILIGLAIFITVVSHWFRVYGNDDIAFHLIIGSIGLTMALFIAYLLS